MREILFRGKRVDNGEWVHGTLNNVLDEVPRIQYAVIEHGMMFLTDFDVIPETVGQYTGLKDVHGTRIFEGDIVRVFDEKYTTTPYFMTKNTVLLLSVMFLLRITCMILKS